MIGKITAVDLGKDIDDEDLVINDSFYENYMALYPEYSIPKDLGTFIRVDASAFIKSTHDKFDLIILSNFLHLFNWESGKATLQCTLNLLTENGIIYIKVANESHKFISRKDRFPIDKNKIEELKSMANIYFLENEEIHYNIILKRLL